MILDKGKGKGKVYYNNGKKKFEGEFLDGKKWNGKVYDYNGRFKADYIRVEIKDESFCLII